MLVSAVLGGRQGGTARAAPGTARRVRQLARQMGYRPNAAAQQLRGKRSDVIGVLIGAESTPANFERLAAVEREAGQREYRLMIGEFRGEAKRIAQYVQDFTSRGIDALVCFHNPMPRLDRHTLKLLSRIRAVVFQTDAPLKHACCVDVDRAAGVLQAMSHLQARGRRRIALVLNSPPESDPLMADRRRGYLLGLKELHYEGPELIWCGKQLFPPPRDLVDDAVAALVIDEKADAIIASNDVWAIELIKAIRRIGRRVPEDVAIVGFDNLQAAELFDPALTSIDQNNADFAKAVVDLLHESLEGPLPVSRRRIVVQPKLIVRQST